jgi:hypothetical protein
VDWSGQDLTCILRSVRLRNGTLCFAVFWLCGVHITVLSHVDQRGQELIGTEVCKITKRYFMFCDVVTDWCNIAVMSHADWSGQYLTTIRLQNWTLCFAIVLNTCAVMTARCTYTCITVLNQVDQSEQVLTGTEEYLYVLSCLVLRCLTSSSLALAQRVARGMRSNSSLSASGLCQRRLKALGRCRVKSLVV